MTEAEWLSCAEPEPMLQFLEGKATERKLRLFAAGCCRSAWDHLSSRSQSAVIVAERDIDGDASGDELGGARRTLGDEAYDEAFRLEMIDGELQVPDISRLHEGLLLREFERRSFRLAAVNIAWLSTCSGLEPEGFMEQHFPRDWQVVLRDLFGPVLFRPVTIDHRWLTTGVVTLSRGIYEDHAFDRMPILGDALEEAGCDNPEILAHCRSATEHVRGCWVVDALLGKE